MKFQCGACGTEATVQDGLPTYDADRLVLIMEAHAKGCPGFPPTSATGDLGSPPKKTSGEGLGGPQSGPCGGEPE